MSLTASIRIKGSTYMSRIIIVITLLLLLLLLIFLLTLLQPLNWL